MNMTRRAAIGGAFSMATVRFASGAITAPIRIGHQCDLTGAFANSGYWRKKSIDAAASWINRGGGIAGRPVQIVTVDTQTNAEMGLIQLQRLVQDHGVDFVIGSQLDEIALGSCKLMQARRQLYLSLSRTALAADARCPFVFSMMPTARSSALTAKRAFSIAGKKWTVVFADDNWGRSQRDAWAQQAALAGAEVIQSIAIPKDAFDVLAMTATISPSADGIFLALLGTELPKAFVSFVQLGLARKTIVTAEAVFGAVDIRSYGSRADGVWGIDTLPWNLSEKDTPAIRALRTSVGIDPAGREIGTGRHAAMGDVSASWETLSFLKRNIEGAKWQTAVDTPELIKYAETNSRYPEGEFFPQGDLFVRPQDHQAFCNSYLMRIDHNNIVVRSEVPLTDTMYPVPISPAVRESGHQTGTPGE